MNWLCRLAQLLFVAPLLTAPWLYGSVYEWHQLALWIAVIASFGLALISTRRSALETTLLFSCLTAGVAWGLLQLVPLPVSLIEIISPNSANLRAELDPLTSSRQTLTFRPTETRYHLAMLVMAVMAVVIGSRLFVTRRAITALFALVAINGAMFGFFGIVQRLTWNGRIFWIGADGGGDAFAAYVNRNNAGGYLNLCLAFALGWLLLNRTGTERRRESPVGAVRSLIRDAAAAVGRLKGTELIGLAAGICIAAAVLMTLSRGAALALFGAAIVTVLALGVVSRRYGLAGWLMVAFVAGLGLVSWSGYSDSLQARLETLEDRETLMASGRWPNWQDAIQAVPAFPLTGTGLGTYRDMYLMYQDRLSTEWHYHAENQYLQALTEAGIPAVGFMLAALVLALSSSVRLLQTGRGDVTWKMAVGSAALFGLTSQAVHGVVDFGLYFPANFLLLAVLTGIVAASEDRERQNARPSAYMQGFTWLLLPLSIFLAMDLYQRAVARDLLIDTRFEEALGGVTDDELQQAIEPLQLLASKRPDDAELWYRIGKLELIRYRIGRLAELRRETTTSVPIETLWEWTTPALAEASLAENDELSRSLDALVQARAAAPLLAKTHLRILSITRSGDDARRVLRCDPSSPFYVSESGRLLYLAGEHPDGFQVWRRLLTLSPRFIRRVIDVVEEPHPKGESTVEAQQFVEQAMPDDAATLIAIASEMRTDSRGLKDAVLTRASSLLEGGQLRSAKDLYLRGRIEALQGSLEQAIRQYELAIQADPSQAEWRYWLARALSRSGRTAEARTQAIVAMQLDPTRGDYRELAEQLQ